MADTAASLAQALQSGPQGREIPSGKKSPRNGNANSAGESAQQDSTVNTTGEGHFDKMIRLAAGKKGKKVDQDHSGAEISIADLIVQGSGEHANLPIKKMQSGEELTASTNPKPRPSLIARPVLAGNQVITGAKELLDAEKQQKLQAGKLPAKEIETPAKQNISLAMATEGKVAAQAKAQLTQMPHAKLETGQPGQGSQAKSAMLQMDQFNPVIAKKSGQPKPINIKGQVDHQAKTSSTHTEQSIPVAAVNGMNHASANASAKSQGLPGKVDLAEVIASRSGKGPDEQKKATLMDGSSAEKSVSFVRTAGNIEELSQIGPVLQKRPSVPVVIKSTTSISQEASEAMERPAVRQLSNFLHSQSAKNGDEMVLHLDPPELGRIKMAFKAEGNTLRLVMEIENPRTLEDIQRSAPGLIQRLNDSGIDVGKMELLSDDSSRNNQMSTSQGDDGLEKDLDSNSSSEETRSANSDSLPDDSPEGDTDTNPMADSGELLDGESVNVWI